jgi:hypothetical protein
MAEVSNETLKDIAYGQLVNDSPDAVSVAEMLWETVPGFRELTDAEQDELLDAVFELCSSAEVSVTWPDD